jgi:preprotein translocase subunit SecA
MKIKPKMLDSADIPAASIPPLERYPQRLERQLLPFDASVMSVLSYLRAPAGRRQPWGANARIVRKVRAAEAALPETLDACLALLPGLRHRARSRQGALRLADAAPLLAVLKHVSRAVVGQDPFDVQIAAVWSLMLGEVAEMGTGEGKSLTAALGAAALALCGRRVHVLTVNDYLAARDAERFAAFLQALGLSSGCILEDTAPDARRAIYRCDVVFSDSKNIVFDYLRDQTGPVADQLTGLASKLSVLLPPRLGTTTPILQGLDAAIVDEADSVLIDQAATPFILSGGEASMGGLDEAVFRKAHYLALKLVEDRDFRRLPDKRRVLLSDAGKQVLGDLVDPGDGLLTVAPVREHIVSQALVALYLFERNRDYLVEGGAVQIIDESTGRVMADRQWSEGLHQLVEIKEGLPPGVIRKTLGRITFQRFFPRYRHLCGMTGTASPAARELWETYALRVRKILPRRPDCRRWPAVMIHDTADAKWHAIGARVRQCVAQDVPVLIGTRSVGASRQCSAVLNAMGLDHHLLNAEEIEREAMIVALAGEPGQVTVATNMAGRGTDIVLADPVRAAGGLRVILTELHENRRIDLQLAGRCGRQGDPGEVLLMLSLEDELFALEAKGVQMLARVVWRVLPPRATFLLMRVLQYRQTRRAEAARRRLQSHERYRERTLALSGTLE